MRKTSKLLAIIIAIIMVLPFIPFSVFAQTNSYTITFSANSGHTVEVLDHHLKVDGNFVDPKLASNPSGNFNGFNVTASGSNAVMTITNGDAVVLNFYTANAYDLFVGQDVIDPTTTFTANTSVVVKDYDATKHNNNNNNNNQGQQQGNTNATVTVTGSGFTEASLGINNTFIDLYEYPVPTSVTRNVSYNYNAATDNGKVTLRFESRITDIYTGTVKVNGQSYNVSDYLDYTNREQYLNHYKNQMVGFEIKVPKADNYNIEMNLGRASENTTWVGNFLWTGDPDQEFLTTPDGNKVANDNYIGHSKLEIVKIEYVRNGQVVTKTIDQLTDLGEQEIGPGTYYHNYTDGSIEYGYLTKQNNKAVSYDDGSLVVPEGAKVTMKIVPKYGYQVTSFGVNGSNIITGANISEFTFTVRKGNFHLGAQVTSVNNTVKSDSKAVTGGVIKMGDTEISTGTARLEVGDAVVSDEKKAEFQGKIGQEYELSEILNISLNQVFYKGTADDVWTGAAIEDLKEYAIIQLQLTEDIDPDNTIIYHNIHDGEEYEEIEIISYDKETRILTIKVKSFSNYAIATKVNTETKSPKTGDTIEIFFATFAVAVVAMGTVLVIRRKR